MAKRIDVLLRIGFMAIFLLVGFAAAQQPSAKSQGRRAEKKILIVYLSRTNNTKAIADIIHEMVGGQLVALELQTPYPADYHATVQQVVRENETGYLPPLKTVIDAPDQYDVIFVGFPTWDMKLPPPYEELPASVQLPGKDNHSVQLQRRVRPWKHLSNCAGALSAKQSAAGFLYSGRTGTRRTAPWHQRCQGRRGSYGRRQVAKDNRDAQVGGIQLHEEG